MNGLVGQQIDNYKVTAFIARGGMAEVYLAEDVNLQRPLALKVMLSDLAMDETAVARFQREARTVAKLDHPNIIQIYTTGTTPNNQPYLAMQYVEGGSLQEKLALLARQGQQMSLNEALTLVYDMARALQVAHSAGIVHRDLKPSNILLQPDGRPILTDLGIAAVQSNATRLTRTGNVLGTPHYMAPEQARGETVDGRTDIYALGIILYELLSGHVPFDADSPLAVLHQHIYQELPPLRQFRQDLSATTYQTVATCLHKAAGDRFQTAADLALALEHAMVSEGVRTPHVLAPYPGSSTDIPATRSNKWLYALGTGLSVIFLALIGWWIWSSTPELPPLVTATPTQTPASITTDIVPSATAVPPTLAATKLPPGIFKTENTLYADGEIILAGDQEFPDCLLQEPVPAPAGDHFLLPIMCSSGNNTAAIFTADGGEKQVITGAWDYIYEDYYAWTDNGRFLVYLRHNDCCGQSVPTAAPAPGVVWVDVENGRKEMHDMPNPLFSYRVVDVANDDVLNIRSGPNADEPFVGDILSNGTDINITGLSVKQGADWWVPITYANNNGWVNGRFLEAEIEDTAVVSLLAMETEMPDDTIDSADIQAKRLMTPPQIDGRLNEWAGFPAYASAHQVYNVESWDGSDDLEAGWRLGWDAEHLYLAVLVEDDRHVQLTSDIYIYEGDSVEIQFDTDLQGDTGSSINTDDYQLNISPGDFADVSANAFLWRASAEGKYELIGGRDVTFGATPRTPGGYLLEAAVPWTNLGIVPAPGLIIGIALNVSDNDRPGDAVQEVMKSSVSTRTFRSPETWGTLTLSE